MDFLSKFFNYLTEAKDKETKTVGNSLRKETAMSSATDRKSRDAARKREERASKPKRESVPSTQLIKDIIPVKTADGKTELIYKDSFDKNYHQVINPEKDLSVEDAKAYTKDEAFVQTDASQRLFGNLRDKAAKKEQERVKKEVSQEKGQVPEEETGPELEKKKFVKPKKLSMQDLLASMGTMDASQLGSIPFDLRQDFFMQNRNPMEDKDFDDLTFEAVATKFGISKVDLPYNEQVKNALIILSRLKAGASDQELAFVTGLKNGMFTQFGREAFQQAKKMLSQVGNECIQMMVSASEAGLAGVSAEGKLDFACGKLKFVVNAQGEISMSSNDMTQQGKSVRKTLQRSLVQVMQDPDLAEKDPIYKNAITQVNAVMANTAPAVMSDEAFAKLSKDPNALALMQQEPVIAPTGQDLGPMVMPNGELNPAISFKRFEDAMTRIVDKFISQQKSKKAPFIQNLAKTVAANQLRGDGVVDPENAPSHLVTGEGVFPMSDEYFATIAGNSDVKIEKAATTATHKKNDISRYKVMIEQAAAPGQQAVDPMQQLRDTISASMTPIGANPIEVLAGNLLKQYNFDMNMSLLPGVAPKDLHGIEYNFLKVHGKTFRIPVAMDQELVASKMAESYSAANSLILESIENDSVLSALYHAKAISYEDAENLVACRFMPLAEATEYLIPILNQLDAKLTNNPTLISECAKYLEEAKKRKRNYKREYKLFHGKPSQIKKRAKRVTARRRMEAKGKVHKGDGKDVDHKKPLRNGGTNGESNLRIRSKSDNRSDNGKYKGQPADKPRNDE